MKTRSSQPEKILLGIDPGTNVMGYGVLRVCGNKAELVVMGVIDMRREKDVYLRLGRIFELLSWVSLTCAGRKMYISDWAGYLSE